MYEYQGIKGLGRIAAHVGMTRSTLTHRVVRLKMPIEEAVKQVRMRREYCYEGIKGLGAIGEKVGVPEGVLSYRIHQLGMTLEEAIHDGRRSYQRHYYKGLSGVPSIAKRFGIPVSTIKSRLARGWSIEQAVETPIPHRSERQQRQEPPAQAIKSPDKLNNHWKLALGIGA